MDRPSKWIALQRLDCIVIGLIRGFVGGCANGVKASICVDVVPLVLQISVAVAKFCNKPKDG